MGSPENIGTLLYCASLLEEKTYQMYYELSQKIEHPIAQPLFLSIAQDSLKHSKLFREVSKGFMITHFKEKNCKKGFGKTWNYVIEAAKLVKKKFFNSEELLELTKKLAIIEYSLGEEYSILVKFQTLKYMSQEISKSYGVDLDKVKGILDSIIEDEQKHRQILIEIRDLLTDQESKTDNNPKVKYQNPDAWRGC